MRQYNPIVLGRHRTGPLHPISTRITGPATARNTQPNENQSHHQTSHNRSADTRESFMFMFQSPSSLHHSQENTQSSSVRARESSFFYHPSNGSANLPIIVSLAQGVIILQSLSPRTLPYMCNSNNNISN